MPQPLVVREAVLKVVEALCGLLAAYQGDVGQSPEPSQAEPDAALTARQCALDSGWTPRARHHGQATSGFSPRWFYDHADELPFRVGGRGRKPVRFSRNGLRAWLRAR